MEIESMNPMDKDDTPLSPEMEKILREWDYQEASQSEMSELLNLIPPGFHDHKLRQEYTETILKPNKHDKFY